jgi:hypothetical protein
MIPKELDNHLISRLLQHSGFRWDPSSFEPMVAFFEHEPKEHQQAFINASKSMSNAQFEKTVYWGIISGHVCSRDKRCLICASPSGLQVHHTSYEHRGEEHRYLNELRSLCRPCHTVQHQHLVTAQAHGMQRINPGMSLDQLKRQIFSDAAERRYTANRRRNIRSPWD